MIYKKQSENKISNLYSLIIENNEKYIIRLKNCINPNMEIKSKLLYKMRRDGIQKFINFLKIKDQVLI